MTEIARITSIQTSLISMDEFDENTVVVNDNSVLDKAGSGYAGNVYAILYTSDTFISRQETRQEQTTWEIPVMLALPFEGWKDSLDAFITLRQAVLDKFNSTSEANRVDDGAYISEIRNETPIEGIYDSFVDFNEDSEPDFLSQRLIFHTEEY